METGKKEYNIIYADPPWMYRVSGEDCGNGAAGSHYKVQSLEELKRLDISMIAAKDCVLFMWASFPLLQEALQLGKAWGFYFKTVAFTWIKLYKHSYKPVIGLGHYTRASAEIVPVIHEGQTFEAAIQ